MADHIVAATYREVDGLIDMTNTGPARLSKISAEAAAGWDRLLLKMLGAKSPPGCAGGEKSAASQGDRQRLKLAKL